MAKSSKSSTKITVNRSAKNGQFVTAKKAKANPSTTETEHYKRSKKK